MDDESTADLACQTAVIIGDAIAKAVSVQMKDLRQAVTDPQRLLGLNNYEWARMMREMGVAIGSNVIDMKTLQHLEQAVANIGGLEMQVARLADAAGRIADAMEKADNHG